MGLVVRVEDADDRRVVRLALTAKGANALRQLTPLYLEELARLSDDLHPFWAAITAPGESDGNTGEEAPVSPSAGQRPPDQRRT